MQYQTPNNIQAEAFSFKDENVENKYIEWNRPLVQNKVFLTTLLTAILYIVYSQLHKIVAPLEMQDTMIMLHLYITTPYLLFISFLAYNKLNYKLMIFLLMIAPIVAAIYSLYIISNVDIPLIYLSEIHLIIIWIFTISGLRLKHATISASVVVIMAFCTTNYIYPLNEKVFTMNMFWMSASFSLGFLNAFIFERSNRTVFLNTVKLETLATTDILTGLNNRSKLSSLLSEEIGRSKRFGHSFGLTIIDIDFFKRINDQYGHIFGDVVLVEVADIIQKNTRSVDTVVRWGGEEFIIIYLEVDKDEILKLSEKLRAEVEKHLFENIDQQTISIGATLYEDKDDIKSIINRADSALYKAKGNGRNRVEFL
ncbi:GGDEF domain-containing protein [Sulfurimonas sp.]|nr:GGDEF domain-containing protein [Sulfurimonas sp.]